MERWFALVRVFLAKIYKLQGQLLLPLQLQLKLPLTYPTPVSAESFKEKRIRKVRCLSAASFEPFPFFLETFGVSETAWSPFLGYLFWRRKKSNWLSGHPDLLT